MERIYTIEQHDNGWSIGDELGGSSVCEEKTSDTGHRKFKQFLGDYIYADIDYFFEENETCKVRVKMVIEETETDLSNNKTNES